MIPEPWILERDVSGTVMKGFTALLSRWWIVNFWIYVLHLNGIHWLDRNDQCTCRLSEPQPTHHYIVYEQLHPLFNPITEIDSNPLQNVKNPTKLKLWLRCQILKSVDPLRWSTHMVLLKIVLFLFLSTYLSWEYHGLLAEYLLGLKHLNTQTNR